jgi:hypothetical protein
VAPLALDTRFAGLSLVADGGSGSPDKYYVFSGTDSVTGQVFDSSTPRLWGGRLQFQVIGGGAFTADQMFTLSTPSGDPDLPAPGNYLQIVRNEDFAGAAQTALKFLPTNAWTAQGFALIGFRIRLPSGYPTTTNHQFTLMEVKSQGGDAPYPVKAENKDIAIGMNRVEEQSLDEQVATGFLVLGPDVNDDEKWVVKLAEFIEMWEWGAEELLMGNQFARLVMQRCATVAKDRIGSALNLSPEDNVMFRAATLASEYMQKRKTIWEL